MEVSDQLQSLATLHLGAESHMHWTQHITVQKMGGPPAPSDKPILIHWSQLTATNNYTKKFLQAHTDLPNSKARYWKTLTFAELKGFVACLINVGTHTHTTITFY
jgi:hypothetical protein